MKRHFLSSISRDRYTLVDNCALKGAAKDVEHRAELAFDHPLQFKSFIC
jgi:hypothetical protein